MPGHAEEIRADVATRRGPVSRRRFGLWLAVASLAVGGTGYAGGRHLSPETALRTDEPTGGAHPAATDASPDESGAGHASDRPASPSDQNADSGGDAKGMMPNLVGKPWSEVDRSSLGPNRVLVQGRAGRTSGATIVVQQSPAPGEPQGDVIELTVMGPAKEKPLHQAVEGLPAPRTVDFHGRSWKEALVLDAAAAEKGVTIEVPLGTTAVTWHAWMHGASDERATATMEVTAADGRLLQRGPVNRLTARRMTLRPRGGEKIRITVTGDAHAGIVLADATVEGVI